MSDLPWSETDSEKDVKPTETDENIILNDETAESIMSFINNL